MKNTKLLKLLVLVLSLALTLGAVIGFSVSADGEDAEKLAIISQNVSYEGKTHLYFAVYYENVTDPTAIKLNVSYENDEGETVNLTVSNSEEVVLEGSGGTEYVCRAFRTPGVDAKNFTKVFTVKAYTETCESAAKNYSVTEYCNQWLFDLADEDALTEEQQKIKTACETTLAYGTDIQALLNYYPNGNTADYPENYVYVKGTDGITVNGASAACVIKGTAVTLAYGGSETVIGWSVADLEGTEIEVTDGAFVAGASCIASPVFTDAKGEYFLSNNPGRRDDYDTMTSLNTDNFAYSGVTVDGVNTKTGSFSIVDGALLFEDGDAENTYMAAKYWYSPPASYNVTIFEFDFKLDQAYGTYPIQIKLANLTHTIYYANLGSGYQLCMEVDGVKTALGTPMKAWSTIRFEHYYDEDTLKVFINNEFVFDISTSEGKKGQTPMIYLTANERTKTSNADLWVDNVYVGHLTKTFVKGDPKLAE